MPGESEGDKTTLQGLIETVEEMYRQLLKTGYKLNEIEEMDLFYYIYLLSEEKEEKQIYTPIENLRW